MNRRGGLCTSSDHHLFFGAAKERPAERGAREDAAFALCAACPIVDACRNDGRRSRAHGIWGGETEHDRAAAGYGPHWADKRSTRDRMAEANDERVAHVRELHARGVATVDIAARYGTSTRTIHRLLAGP